MAFDGDGVTPWPSVTEAVMGSSISPTLRTATVPGSPGCPITALKGRSWPFSLRRLRRPTALACALAASLAAQRSGIVGSRPRPRLSRGRQQCASSLSESKKIFDGRHVANSTKQQCQHQRDK
eukprot:2278147-Prymnesium_polylepis.2